MKTPTGIELIKAERRRQITKEKWTIKHDDSHKDGTLFEAASAYERFGNYQMQYGEVPSSLRQAFDLTPRGWRWDAKWWKPGRSCFRTFVKAGALFQAEVDRLERLIKRRGSDASFSVYSANQAKKAVLRLSQKIDGALK